MPVLTIFAGPNGSGKSSIIRRVDSPEQSIQRIRERVTQSGHNVPDEDVRRRYVRSLSYLQQIVTIANETLVYDNSGVEPTLMIDMRAGIVMSESSETPSWVRDLLEAIRP